VSTPPDDPDPHRLAAIGLSVALAIVLGVVLRVLVCA
jgi:hypothetical protein